MSRLVLQTLCGSALLAWGVTVAAQTALEPAPNPYYSEDEYQNAHSMFDKIQADLSRAATNAYPNPLGDAARIDVARTELGQLADGWDHGQYGSRRFDLTRTAIQMVLNDNKLTLHDQKVLGEDLIRLLEFGKEYY